MALWICDPSMVWWLKWSRRTTSDLFRPRSLHWEYEFWTLQLKINPRSIDGQRAKLLKRTFQVDVCRCPKCQSTMQRVSLVQTPDAIAALLSYDEASEEARGPPQSEGEWGWCCVDVLSPPQILWGKGGSLFCAEWGQGLLQVSVPK